MAFFKPKSHADKRGLLRRLASDRAGNVFAITAAAVVPMIGVVGGAIDASRLYMTRTRLQAACDSGVLAGRKAMTTLSYTDANRAQARAMFNFNFKDADFDTTGTEFLSSGETSGRVNATASTTVPMTLMKVFGAQSRPVSVACSADIQIPNIDIVFVLDVTGSMNETVDSVRKIDALQNATMRFYDEIAARVGPAGASRVRYGFVPYSQTVNVGSLFTSTWDEPGGRLNGEAPLTHLADTMSVQSRVANFTNEPDIAIDTSESPFEFNQTFSESRAGAWRPWAASADSATSITGSDCNDYAANGDFYDGGDYIDLYPHGDWDDAPVLYATSKTATSATRTIPNQNTFWKITFSKVSGSDTNQKRVCTRKVRWVKEKKLPTTHVEFKNYTYQNVSLPSAAFKAGQTISYVTRVPDNYVTTKAAGSYNMMEMATWSEAANFTTATTRWDGCIEERDTVPNSSFSPIPTDAFDLNALLGGTNAQTRWRPVMDDLTWNRNQVANLVSADEDLERPGYSCPTARVRNLRNWTESEFDAYVATLDPPVGFTYLDIGMIWGLRLIAPQGIWGARNLTGTNNGQIARHLIFLTDGQPVSEADTYSSYGVERMARRITGTANLSTAAARHEARFLALCNSMRNTVTVWTIAFDTPTGTILSDCADEGRDKTANNAASLNSVFTEIANDISDLRLVR